MDVSSYLIFPSGSVPGDSQSAIITLYDDLQMEAVESLQVILTSDNPSHVVLESSLIINIIDDDGKYLPNDGPTPSGTLSEFYGFSIV